MPCLCRKLPRNGGVTPAITIDGPAGALLPAGRHILWTWPLSASVHAILIALLLVFWTVRPILTPPVRSIDVQVLTPSQYDAVMAPEPILPAPQQTPAPPRPAAVLPPVFPGLMAQEPTKPGFSVPNAAESGMVHASRLYSTGLLREPASLEVRNTLPTLAPYERITQLCNIEGTEQIRRALKGANPETISASAFAETNLVDGVLKAPGAAYRSHAKWFFMAFECKVRSDLTGVADFSFKLGPPIPKDQWEAHDLIGIDEDDEDLGTTSP